MSRDTVMERDGGVRIQFPLHSSLLTLYVRVYLMPVPWTVL